MSVIEGWPMSAVLMMLLCTSMFCSGYNVDIESPIIHRGPDRSKFGYQAEFIKQTTGSVKLFVTAPYQEVISRDRSGHYYLSDPLQVSTREHRNTLPVDRRPEVPIVVAEHFGEEKERFGQTLLLVNSSTVLVCGPLWNDILGWSSEYPFPVGRCQLVPPGNSSLVLPQNRTTYISYIYVDGSWVSGFFKGFAQFGFSAANLQEGNVLVGIPGYTNGRGTFGILNLSNGKIDLMPDMYDIQSYAYLGFAVAGGNFCGGTKVCLAASNRMSNGKVYIMEWETLSGFKIFRLLQSPQDYSSYGFSMCSMDINGDGLSDLLVGAPAYSDHSNTPPSYDEGRVYVYLHLQENSSDNITLAGGRRMFASFGSAIGDIGDINRDSIHDVAVGAPQEDDGRGAVYIYLGSSKGPETTFSQRISGQDIDSALFSFGSHISRSTTGTSPYNYPDFAVGSPESNAVVVLRTRLIVDAKANIITPPSPINSTNNNCPAAASNPSFKASGCIKLQLCLSFSADDPRGHYQNLSFDVSFEIDTLLSYDGVRRVRLLTNGQTETSVMETLNVKAGKGDCKTYDAILREDQIFRNPFIPVKMKATFALNVTSLKQPLKPVLNPTLPNETTTELRFINKCGEDQTCDADLVLEGRVMHEPVEQGLNLNIVNTTSEVKLDLTLVNKQETAYGVKITTQIQGRIRFRFVTGDQGASHFSCEAKDRDDNTTVGSLVTCNKWSPLAQGEVLPVRLVFDAVSVPLEETSRVINFEVKAMPSDPLQNPEVNDKDNVLMLNSTKVIVAEVHIDGSSDPKALYVIDSNVPELVAVQTLLVTNYGPSFLPSTYVNISLPYMDMEGRELLTSHNVSIKYQDGSELQCTPTSLSEASVLTTTRTPPSTASSSPATPLTPPTGTATTTQKPMPSGATRTTREPEELTFGPVDPSRRRRRRQAGEEKQVETTDNSDQDRDNERLLQINCQTYRCKTFQCNLHTLHRNGQATIMVSLALNKRVLEVSQKVDAIFYNTSSTVAEPSTPFFYRWSKLPTAKVSTIIYIKSSEGINIWIIIGGILGGIVLLIIIALILKKLGFFRRADKAKLERLKRQSGYYNKRRPPSSAPSPAEQKT